MRRWLILSILIFCKSAVIFSQSEKPGWLQEFSYCFGFAGTDISYQDALDISDKHIENSKGDYREKIAFYVVKSWAMGDSISPDTGIYFLSKVLPFSLASKTGEIITRNYWALGRCYYKKSMYQKAVECFLQHDLYSGIYELKNEQLRANYYLGSCFKEMGKYIESNRYSLRAYGFARELNDTFAIERCLISLANNFLVLQNPDSALYYLNLDGDIFRKGELINLAYYEGALGGIYLQKKNFKLAKNHQLQALKLFEKCEEDFGIAQCTENLGSIYLAELKYDSALTYLKRSELLNQDGFYGTPITLYQRLFTVYQNLGEFDKAVKYMNLYLKEDSLINKYDLKYINELKDSFLVERNELILTKEREGMKKLYNQKARYLLISSIAGLLVILIIIFSIYRWSIIKKEAEKNEMKSQLNEVKLKALQSQMNPHFIFNCLATIDSLVLQNRQDEASLMIEKFSRLVRLILENSKFDRISVKDDVAMLHDYVDLELMRTKNKFSFQIELPKEIEDLKIPSMVIQPLVENSIIHGVRNVQHGEIKVGFHLINGYLQVSVKDNGSGNKDTKQGVISGEKKTSLGTSITQERLRLLDKGERSVYLEYKVGENGGMEAILYIPIAKDRTV